MANLADDIYLSKVESELMNILKIGDFSPLSSSDDGSDDDFADLDSLESEFAEFGEYIAETEEASEPDTKVNVLIETLEKAQTLVRALRDDGNPEPEGDNDSLQRRLDQVESAVNQAHKLLKRLEQEVSNIRKTVNSHPAQ